MSAAEKAPAPARPALRYHGGQFRIAPPNCTAGQPTLPLAQEGETS